ESPDHAGVAQLSLLEHALFLGRILLGCAEAPTEQLNPVTVLRRRFALEHLLAMFEGACGAIDSHVERREHAARGRQLAPGLSAPHTSGPAGHESSQARQHG